jgi:hypothetical protein
MAEHDDELRLRIIADPNIEGWVRAIVRSELRNEQALQAKRARSRD